MEMRLLATASTGTTVPSSPHRFFISRNFSPSSCCSNSLLKPRLGSLSLLLPARVRSRRSIGPRLGACASAGDEVEDSVLASGGFPRPISVKIPFGDRHINDKEQLRLSRRALLPDSESVEIVQSGDVSAVVTSKTDSTEDSSDEEGSELSQDKASASNPACSPQPRKKLVRRSVSPDKEKSLISKVKPKKSVSKAVSSIYTKEESSLVNGEAKVG